MSRLLESSVGRGLMIAAIAGLVFAGGVYAGQVLWSGTAKITIEPPAGSGLLEVTRIESDSNGDWNDTSGTWTVSLARGKSCLLTVNLKNVGDDVIDCPYPYVNGEMVTNTGTFVAPGVQVWQASRQPYLAAGATGHITFGIEALPDAEAGTVPDVRLEIRW